MTQIKSSYAGTALRAVDGLDKLCETTRANLETLGLPTLQVEVIQGEAGAVKRQINMFVGKTEFELPPKLFPTLRAGCKILLGKLEKVRGEQMKLGVDEPDDTDHAIVLTKKLVIELSGQGTFDTALSKAEGATEAPPRPRRVK